MSDHKSNEESGATGSSTNPENFRAKSSQEAPKSLPKTSPHFIGYHAEKLYKMHGHLRNAEAIAFLPGEKVIAADKHTGHVVVIGGEGEEVAVRTRTSKPSGIAVFSASGNFAVADPKDKDHQIKVNHLSKPQNVPLTSEHQMTSFLGFHSRWGFTLLLLS